MSDHHAQPQRVAVIGGGFCGLAAAYELSRHRIPVTVYEQETEVGGLAGSFRVNGVRLEKFYHHWFASDRAIFSLVQELGLSENIVLRQSKTGMYFGNQFHRLTGPLDLLRFRPLGILNRLRLGRLTLRARTLQDWTALEELTAEEWVTRNAGAEVYRVVWKPLLDAKFGPYAKDISAVWLWSKLRLRGGSRGKNGQEQLAYFRGGFSALADALVDRIVKNGGEVCTATAVHRVVVQGGMVRGVVTAEGTKEFGAVIATPPLPLIVRLLAKDAPEQYVSQLGRTRYLASLCLVLELTRGLSPLYWININDPGFPFVGLIEHTNFESPNTYGGTHLVYLSRYLLPSDPMFVAADEEITALGVAALERMFAGFQAMHVQRSHVWRARYAQPIVERGYAKGIPLRKAPIPGLFIATMAQIYPEDRGTNYAVRDGRRVALDVMASFGHAGRL